MTEQQIPDEVWIEPYPSKTEIAFGMAYFSNEDTDGKCIHYHRVKKCVWREKMGAHGYYVSGCNVVTDFQPVIPVGVGTQYRFCNYCGGEIEVNPEERK